MGCVSGSPEIIKAKNLAETPPESIMLAEMLFSYGVIKEDFVSIDDAEQDDLRKTPREL